MDEKQYLIRIAGISFEILRENFHRNRIEYHVKEISGDGKFFRDIHLDVRPELEKLFNNYEIIPSANDAFRRFDHERRIIELNAIYNIVINNTNVKIKPDINYIEITDRYAKNMGVRIGEMPRTQPKDRIRVYEMEDKR